MNDKKHKDMTNFDFQQTAPAIQELLNSIPDKATKEELEQLRELYEALTQSEIIPVPSADWPVSDPQENVIYRVAGTSSYTDYMWDGTSFIPMATYDIVLTDIPSVDSTDVITAGGVANHGSAFDISEYNKNGATLATYANLSAALAAVPSSVQKGGMSIKFVRSSDNKYVQWRLMSQTFSNDEADWQGVDDEPMAKSDNLVKSGGVYNIINGASEMVGYTEVGNLTQKSGDMSVYYFAVKPADGYVDSMYVKVGTGTLNIYLVSVNSLGGPVSSIAIKTVDLTNYQDGDIINISINRLLASNQYIGFGGTNAFYFGQAQGWNLYRNNGVASNYAAAVYYAGSPQHGVLPEINDVNCKIDDVNHKIDSLLKIDGYISNGNIDSYGIVKDDTPSRTLYYVECYGIEKIKVSNGDLYGFFNDIPQVGLVEMNAKRYIENLNDTIIDIPSHTQYIAVRAASEPIFEVPEDGVTQRLDSVEELVEPLMDKEIYNPTLSSENAYSASDGYSVCTVPAGTVIKIVKVCSPDGTTPVLEFAELINDTLYGRARFTLNAGAGSDIYVETEINYECKTEQYVIMRDGFYFEALETTENIPYIVGNYQYGAPYSAQGRGRVDLNYKMVIISYGELNALSVKVENLEDAFDIREIASDISMFENIGFCGDSYTAGMIVVSENPTVTAENRNLCWGKILERTHGVNSFIYAKGGVSVVDVKPYNPNYLDDADCLPKLLSETAKNLYVISLGHNDCYISSKSPSVYGKSWTKEEFLAEFNTNYRSIISQVAAHAPNAKIILCKQSGPYARMGWGTDINNTISDIGEDLGLPVLDPNNDRYLSSTIYEQTMIHDHPVFAGYAGIAKAFDRQFCWATVEYFDYFKGYTGL